MRSLLLIASAVVLAACGPPRKSNEAPPERWPGGLYGLTPSPATQTCGDAQVTFTAERVFLQPDYENEILLAFWDDGQVVAGSLDDTGRFVVIWDLERVDDIPCPGSGPSVTTRITSVWVGTPNGETLSSELIQEIDDDCDPAPTCSVSWALHGTRE